MNGHQFRNNPLTPNRSPRKAEARGFSTLTDLTQSRQRLGLRLLIDSLRGVEVEPASQETFIFRVSVVSASGVSQAVQISGGDRIRLDHARSGLRVVVDQLAT
jgi:hypothetical protein